jgi:hypothetical protein
MHHSEVTSNRTIEIGEVSVKSIKKTGHKGIIHEEVDEDYDIKIYSPTKSEEEAVAKQGQKGL